MTNKIFKNPIISCLVYILFAIRILILYLQLSISEYRQRKQREEVEKSDGSDDTTSPASHDEERPSSASPSDTLLEMSDTKTGKHHIKISRVQAKINKMLLYLLVWLSVEVISKYQYIRMR